MFLGGRFFEFLYNFPSAIAAFTFVKSLHVAWRNQTTDLPAIALLSAYGVSIMVLWAFLLLFGGLTDTTFYTILVVLASNCIVYLFLL
jgi:hypothetical protein